MLVPFSDCSEAHTVSRRHATEDVFKWSGFETSGQGNNTIDTLFLNTFSMVTSGKHFVDFGAEMREQL